MKLFCLGEHDANCFLLSFKNTNILLDCGIELNSLLKLPFIRDTNKFSNDKKRRRPGDSDDENLDFEIKLHTPSIESLDVSQIDAILISNYMNMLALPYIVCPSLRNKKTKQQHTNPQTTAEADWAEFAEVFTGEIYATEPTIQIGKKMMEELVIFNQSVLQHREESTKQDEVADSSDDESESNDDVALYERAQKKQRTGEQPASAVITSTSNNNSSGAAKYLDEKDIYEFTRKMKKLYNMKHVEYCISKIKSISFHQHIQLFGTFEVFAVSSGFCLGSANWIIRTKFEKMVYISTSSATATRHPDPLHLEDLKNANIALLTDVQPIPSYALASQPLQHLQMHSPENMLNEFCKYVGMTINNGGDVVIPCYSSGLIYDLIDYTRTYLNSINLTSTPMYFVSPIADHSLTYSNILSEWLCESKQQRAFVAEPPFAHMNYLRTKQLQVFSNIQQFSNTHYQSRSQPCIVFTGHPCLRFGDVVHLLRLFDQSEKNVLVVVEADYEFRQLIEPLELKKMKAHRCPIDLRLNLNEVNVLMKQIKPQHLILETEIWKQLGQLASTTAAASSSSAQNPSSPKVKQEGSAATTSGSSGATTQNAASGSGSSNAAAPTFVEPLSFIPRIETYNHLDVLDVTMKRKYEQAQISEDLAGELYSQEIKGSHVSRVNAFIQARDGQYLLTTSSVAPAAETSTQGLASQQILFGEVGIPTIIRSLQENGFDVKVTEKEFGVYEIELLDTSAVIFYSAQETRIETRGEDAYAMNKLRQNLRRILMDVHHIV